MPSLSDLKLPALSFQLDRSTLDQVHQATLTRCEQLGIFMPGRMSMHKFVAGRFELLSALCYPDAQLTTLSTCNDFITYLFFVDDQADDNRAFAHRPDLLHAYFSGHLESLREGTKPAEADAAGQLLLSIRHRLLERMSESWLTRFADDVEDYLIRGALAGALHWTNGTTPEISEYVQQRVWDSAALCTQDLIEYTGGFELSDAFLLSPGFEQLRRLCSNVVAYTNDLVSYAKELRANASPNNLVYLTMEREGRSSERALAHVVELINADCREFDRLSAVLCASAGNERSMAEHYISAQRACMTANLLWSVASGRYVDERAPFPELRRTVPAEVERAVFPW